MKIWFSFGAPSLHLHACMDVSLGRLWTDKRIFTFIFDIQDFNRHMSVPPENEISSYKSMDSSSVPPKTKCRLLRKRLY
jgi:hypothetical protein